MARTGTAMQENEEESLKAIAALLQAEAERERSRLASAYDGVLGELPSWFPGLDRLEFLRLRNKILERSRASPADVKKWVDAYKRAGEVEGRCDYWPMEFHEEIGRLAQLYAAFLMGPEKGLTFLLGKQHAKTIKRGVRA